MRLLAIGDVHGHSRVLSTLLKLVRPGPGDQFISLGDYVDRGPDSRGVLVWVRTSRLTFGESAGSRPLRAPNPRNAPRLESAPPVGR